MPDNVIEILLKMLGTKDAEGDLKSFSDKAGNIGKSMQKVGVGMTAGLTLPLALIAKSTVESASGVGEAMGAVSSVFGENAKEVEAWATGLAGDFGISKKAGLDAIANYGLILQNMGVTGEGAMDMGQNFVELAADMAAFRDVPVEQALNAVRGALTGEFEMMKQFGIVIKATDLEAKALSMGLIVEGQEMDNLARSTAAAALIMEKTALMQGTVAREGESLAGQTKMMAAEFDNLKAELGAQLIPVILEILPYIKKFLQWIVELSPETKKWALIIGAVVAAIGPLLTILGTLMTVIPVIITVIGAIATPVGLVILAIVAIIATLVLLYLAFKNNWFGIRDIVTTVVDWIYTRTLKPFVELVKILWDRFGEDILRTIKNTWEFIKKVWELATGWISKYFDGWKALFSGDISGAGKIWAELFQDIGEKIKKFVGEALEKIKELYVKALTWILTKITDFIRDALDKFRQWGVDLGTKIRGIWEDIKNIDWMELGKSIITGIARGIVNASNLLRQAAIDAARAAFDAAMTWLRGGSPSLKFAELGESMMQGMAMGIQAMQGLPAAASVGAGAQAMNSVTNNYYLTARYEYQSPTSLMDDVRMLELLRGS